MEISRIIGILEIIMLLAVSCGRERHDSRLESIWEYVSDKPEEAMAALDSIDAIPMTEADRAFYNLISIKAKDKAYVLHTSDSLILTVIDHYSRHKEDGLYAEALYYGGRVYSDLGDYPTALRYFQDALNLLPENTPHLRLRGNVLSQMSGMLDDLGLYQESISLIKSVLKINEGMKDTLNLAINFKSLGAIQLHQGLYSEALNNFKIAECWSKYVTEADITEARLYQAAAYYYMGNINQALAKIRPIPCKVDSISHNLALAYASKIYLAANLLDTAYCYSHQLASSKDYLNKKTGYSVMLSPKLRSFVPKDSLECYYSNYKEILERHFRKQETNGALIQNSLYNYTIHDKKRKEAETSKDKLFIWIEGLIATVSLLIAIIFYIYFRHKSSLLELREVLAKLDALEKSLNDDVFKESDCHTNNTNKSPCKDSSISKIVKDEKSLKIELRNKLKRINETAHQFDVSKRILESRPYETLQVQLKARSPVTNDSNVWTELENLIDECYPQFKERLLLLSDGNLRTEDLQISLLIRCGFTPKQIAILFGRSNGAITYRRKKMCKRLFGEDLDLEMIDSIIRSL